MHRTDTVKVEGLLRNVRELSYGILKPGQFVADGVPMIRVMDISYGSIREAQIVKVEPRIAAAYERTRLLEGDVLLAVMATVGRCAVVPKTLEGANVNRALAVLRMSRRINPHFVSLVIQSPSIQEKFTSEKMGSAQARINIGDLRRFPFPLPSLAEQDVIVRRVEALFKLADTIEKRVAAASRRADRLTQAILSKAFRGELVATEAERARAEGRPYEPALALLERVRASTADQSPRKPSRHAETGQGRRGRVRRQRSG
jgi:type I restriction enzyme S subunit